MKNTFLIVLSFILIISCEGKAQNNKFCLNTNKSKSSKECEECLNILDKMFGQNEINQQDFIIKKLNYFLLLKKYDEALKFVSIQNFKYSQEKEIRNKEIELVRFFCSNDIENFKKIKDNLLIFVDNQMINTKDEKLLTILRNEKSAIESDLIVEYYCSSSKDENNVSIISR
ncbi:hypothetical protein ACFO4P_00520 [Epilithonimonas pallida]|uniref:Uncharacterized protein n=1 Tax=Epilithonimonas pallida TaxID=373671 RepID=A0ABY1R7J1_9FLAO|nr:hypothetical protein [Epilithonimonas pallida]SMP97452.1 hypothetical protein SAMN05421679_11333 [Epilithonimonas pallida]